MRSFSSTAFDTAFRERVAGAQWQELPEYYPRYRSRYEGVLRRFAELAPSPPCNILEVGGGQLAVLATALWGDHITVVDIETSCFQQLQRAGVTTHRWNLSMDAAPPGLGPFDAVLFSEVIEHLPIPGHVALARLRSVLRSGGILVLSTPNLYRLRNAAFLLSGRTIFDHFDLPGEAGFGHVLEYSLEHLEWQFARAGFSDIKIDLVEFDHSPHRAVDRAIAMVGRPLRRIPRFRNNLLATALADPT